MFDRIKATRWMNIIVVMAVEFFIFWFQLNFLVDAYRSISSATKGLIQPTFIAAGLSLLIIIPIIIWIGKLRLSDIGLIWRKLPRGMMIIGTIWLLTQGILVLLNTVQGEQVKLANIWVEKGWSPVLGILISQMLTLAVAEESIFRGFLMPQLYLKFGGSREARRLGTLVIAIIVSQLIFALYHIPNLEHLGPQGIHPVVSLAVIFGLGCFLAFIYLRTRNLFFAIGVHALINAPTPVVQASLIPAEAMVFILSVIILLLWPKLDRTG